MAKLDDLLVEYSRTVALPWASGLSAGERTWFVVYDPPDERRLRLRLSEFELETQKAGHGWAMLDLAGSFARWMAEHEYRDSYFEAPGELQVALDEEYVDSVAAQIGATTAGLADAGNTVLALTGVGSIFGLVLMSSVLDRVGRDIPGRLAVFFPGEFDSGNYRLLGARDGWSYLATPIRAQGSYA